MKVVLGVLGVVAAVALLAVPAKAVTLVTPTGQPIGGQWQTWANEMRVPTVRGPVVLDTSPADAQASCGAAFGCSWGPYPGEPDLTPEIWIDGLGAPSKQTLYYELGHEFDWLDLNAGDRSYLARAWRTPVLAGGTQRLRSRRAARTV